MDAKVKQIEIPFQKGEAITQEQAMQLAIDVAKMGAPYVSPNPLVGCVVVDTKHNFLTYGFHRKVGFDHAEIDAVKKLSEKDFEGATFYVTLEPCAHEGRTGSCAKKLATLPIKKVIYGLTDPNPLVQGQGAEILRHAGIEAQEYEGPLKIDLQEICEVFLKNFTQKKIFIAAKVATSLDGQMALKTGESKWITSPASREYVHELRSYYDAILIGRNTLELDDPSLDVRHPIIEKNINVIVLDPLGETLEKISGGKKYKIFETHQGAQIYFAVHKKVKSQVQQIEFKDLEDLTEKIYHLGLRSLFIEGGAHTYSSFINEGLIDRMYVFMAPVIIGAQNGLSWTNGFGVFELKKKLELKNQKIKSFGQDIFITGRL